MGYQATTVTPANMAPRAQAALPSTTILPRVPSMRATRCGWRRSSPLAASNPARAAATFRSRAFAFVPKTRPMAASTSAISMSSRRATTPT